MREPLIVPDSQRTGDSDFCVRGTQTRVERIDFFFPIVERVSGKMKLVTMRIESDRIQHVTVLVQLTKKQQTIISL